MFSVKRKLRVLTFDIENRPLSYWYEGNPTAEITAIASCWNDNLGSMEVKLLGKDSSEDILTSFVTRYNEADIVCGHYIRKHDLPIINGALMEVGLPQLKPKLSSDTRLDMRKKDGIPATQEYLAALFDLPIQKYHMTQNDWRDANRLTKEGLAITEKRVSSDVLANILLRNKMLEKGLLGAPKTWHG